MMAHHVQTPLPAIAGDLATTLNDALQANADTRTAAETKLAALAKSSPDYVLGLLAIALSPEVQVPVRQLAAIMAQKYISSYWSAKGVGSDQFVGPEPPLQVKQQVRALLLQHGLQDHHQRLRVAFAYAASRIAHMDWPDEWPEFLPAVLHLLQQNHEPHLVHGALSVLKELVRDDLTEHHLGDICNVILPQLQLVYAGEQLPRSMRNLAMRIFRDLIELFYNLKDQNPQVSQYMNTILPPWMDSMARRALDLPAVVPNDDDATLAIHHAKVGALRAIKYLLTAFPKEMKPYAHRVLDSVVRDLAAVAEHLPPEQLDVVDEDSDGQAVNAEHLVEVCTEILRHLSTRTSFQSTFLSPDFCTRLLLCLAQLMQLTDEQIENWHTNIGSFIVAEIEEDGMHFSVRTSCLDLVTSLVDRCAQRFTSMARDLVLQQLHDQLTKHNWRMSEALLTMLMELLVDYDHVVPLIDQLVQHPEVGSHAMLRARVLRLMGRAADTVPPEHTTTLAQFALAAMGDKNPILVVCGMQAVQDLLPNMPPTAAKTHVQEALLGAALVVLPSATEDSLAYALQGIVSAIGANPEAAATRASTILEAVVRTWERAFADPLASDLIVDVVDALARSPEGLDALTQGGDHDLVAFIAGRVLADANADPAIVAIAIDMLDSLVLRAIKLKHEAAARALVARTCPVLVARLTAENDASVLQSAQKCLASMARAAPGELAANQGVLSFVARMLAPDETESRSMNVGDLLQALLLPPGQGLVPIVPDLVRAVAHRLCTARMPTFISRMIVVLALMLADPRYAQPALHTLVNDPHVMQATMAKWVENHDGLGLSMERKLSMYTLMRLVATNDARLQAVQVPGDLPQPSAGDGRRMTRQRARAENHPAPAPVPLFARIAQLAAGDVMHLEAEHMDVGTTPVASDMEDSDLDSEEAGGGVDQLGYLSNVINDADLDFDADLDESDLTSYPELAWLSSMDLKSYLGATLAQAPMAEWRTAIGAEQRSVLERLVQPYLSS